jgi:hypothetical protein
MRCFTFFGLLFFCLSAEAQQSWIPISDNDIIQLNGRERKTGLFNECPELFNEKGIPTKIPGQAFHATYQELYLPQEFLIDLKGEYQLDSLYFFDSAGKDSLQVMVGEPGAWKILCNIYTDAYQSWRRRSFSAKSKLLLIRVFGGQAAIGEMVFYGQKLQSLPQKVVPMSLRRPLSLSEFMGINTFVDDPSTQVAAVSTIIREYHNWDWHQPKGLTQSQALQLGWAFAPATAGPWDFDRYYETLSALNLKVFPCLQGSPAWLADEFNQRPQDLQFSASDPQAYRWHSAFAWQYGARYGAREHPTNLLRLGPGQAYKSGLNLIAGFEAWNEPDKWWKGPKAYFHPFEFAAFMSADYDGHAGQLGSEHGIKQADPELEFIMGGLAALDSNYVEGMRQWALYNRPAGDFPADALNFHHYSNDAGGQTDNAKHGVSPESDNFKEKLEALVRYRNRKLPQQKLYLTEFGYDTNPKSVQAPRSSDALEALETQANYLVRSMLLAHASGIDGAFIYMFRDVNEPNPNKYMSSGLTAEKWNKHRPKPSFHKLKALKNILGDFYYRDNSYWDNENIYQYSYLQPSTGKRAYVLWCAEPGEIVPAKELDFLEESKVAELHYLSDNQELNKAKNWRKGEVLLISNSPIILIFD